VGRGGEEEGRGRGGESRSRKGEERERGEMGGGEKGMRVWTI